MSIKTEILFTASNWHKYFFYALPLSIINIIVLSRFFTSNNSSMITMIGVLIVASSYYMLAVFVVRKSAFFENRIEILFPLRCFGRRKRVVYYSQITKTKLLVNSKEPTTFVIKIKDKKTPITVGYISSIKRIELEKLLKEKGIELKVY